MRRRNTRGSSASSTSSLSSPRSTVTPPPSSSSGVSSPESSGTPPTPDVYPIQQQLDYAGNWHRLKSEASVFDDLPALSLSPSTSRSSPSFAYSTSSPTDSQALDIFMNSSFNDFLDPSIDPSALASLHSTTSFPLGSCGSGPLLPEAADPWSTVQFPYTDFNSHGLPMDPHPMTTSMSGNMNNSSTPSHLCQPQFTTAGGLTLGRFMHSMREPQIGFSHFGGGASTGPGSVQDRAAMLYLQQQIDRHDHRTNMTLGMSDPYSVSSSLHHTGFSDTQ
ncbi:hypothetical protein BC835DRAFT_614538 [Cytidiella melzeri]|nr:hypothetical protein BC835DRAFT_614538 [Cytidiella melzeri]